MYTARVPYYGFVDWKPGQVVDYADALLRAHFPRRRWLLSSRRECDGCGEPWPCSAWVWAHGTTVRVHHSGDLR
jgi:hypothetical protein